MSKITNIAYYWLKIDKNLSKLQKNSQKTYALKRNCLKNIMAVKQDVKNGINSLKFGLKNQKTGVTTNDINTPFAGNHF